MTLLELLIAISIMVIVVGTLGSLAKGVQEGYQYSEGHAAATQHARVALDRIVRTVSEAVASEQFPGVLVVTEEAGQWWFPDTLVVWRPDGEPVDPDGLPRYGELVVFCPYPAEPNRLVEITVPGDMRPVPPPEDAGQWAAAIEAIKAGADVEAVDNSGSQSTVTLTELMRVCPVAEGSLSQRRGAVRFQRRLRPSQGQWTAYREGGLDWGELAWVQGTYGPGTGLRQVWLRIELQLIPSEEAAGNHRADGRPVPFFGSAALHYEMHR